MQTKKLVVIIGMIQIVGLTSARGDVDKGEFLYQGQLKKDSVPVNDTCDFVFSLWRDSEGVQAGDQIGPDLEFNGQGSNPPSIEVVNGLFTALLDFGPTAFTDDPRWLEVGVVCPAGSGPYNTLTPRELVAGAPYSIHTRGIQVNGDGDVSIGSSSPAVDLHVNGNILVGTEGSDAFVELRSDDAADSTTMRLKTLDTIGLATTNGLGIPIFVVGHNGNVGVGTTQAEAPFHVYASGNFRGDHVAFFHSRGGLDADGIAIQLDNPHTNSRNNFITFYNGDEVVTGRIEGFDREFGDWASPPPVPDVGFTFDPDITYNEGWLTPGTLPTANFTPGSLPSLAFNPGLPPSLNFSPGTLPTLTFSGGSLPSANLSPGTLPSLAFNDGSLPSFSAQFCNVVGFSVMCGFNWSAGSSPTANLNGGSLPSLSFTTGSLPTANFNRGTLPSLTFNNGSLPAINFGGGSLPILTFNPGTLPVINEPPVSIGDPSLVLDLPTQQELEDLMCWSFERGNDMFLAIDPLSLAVTGLREQVAAECLDEGVVYGSKGADYAEWLPKLNPNDQFQIGQIVGVHGGKVSLKTEGAEQIMAISRAPVVVGNVPPDDEKDNFVTVGFMGQLPVVVRGEVRAGDFIIASGLGDGTAGAVRPENLKLRHLDKILGRAWSESDNEVYGLVNVSIGLNTGEAAIILRNHEARMDALVRDNDALAKDNALMQRQLAEMNTRLVALSDAVRGIQEHGIDPAESDGTVAEKTLADSRLMTTGGGQ